MERLDRRWLILCGVGLLGSFVLGALLSPVKDGSHGNLIDRENAESLSRSVDQLRKEIARLQEGARPPNGDHPCRKGPVDAELPSELLKKMDVVEMQLHEWSQWPPNATKADE